MLSEGEDVTLTPEGNPKYIVCYWYRGEATDSNRIFTYIPLTPPEQQNGLKFTGRESGGPNCSLHIRNVMLTDAGNYTVSKTASPNSEAGHAHIQVLERVSNVIITSDPGKAIENQLFILECTSAGSNVSYVWSKGDQILELGGHISMGYKNLTFNPIIRNDSGQYTCSGRNSFSSANATYLLNVFYGPDSPIIDPQVSVYNEGSTLNLSCFADSNPPANYSWWHNGQLLEGQKDSQLLVQNVSVSSAGNYTCNATNDYTAYSNATSIEITIHERVSNVIITSDPGKAIENQLFVLDCTSAGSNVSYVWSKGDQILETGGHITLGYKNLTFNPANRNDSGQYTCSGQNSFSSSSASYPLDVFYGPDEPIISPPGHNFAESSPLTLLCYADSHPPAQYAWYINETELLVASSQLSIPSLSFNYTGSYTCSASNNQTSRVSSTRREIKVLEAVSDVTIQGPSETTESDSVTLSCVSRGSEVSYTWFKENQPLKDGGHITLLTPSHEKLTLSPVSRSDAGSYTCRGNNSISEDSSNPFLLDVFYGPDDPIISPLKHDYLESSDLNITCQADSKPVANYTWFFNETEVRKGAQLLIPGLSFDKTGDYICNATNDRTHNSSAAAWEIRVLEKLSQPILEPDNFFVKVHTDITFNCSISARSSVTVSWFKDEKPVPAKAVPSEQNRTLTVPDVSKDDEGMYICEARNPVDSARSNPSKVVVDSPTDNGLTAGQIVGIVIGCLLGVALIGVVLYFVLKGTALGPGRH